MAMQEEKRDLPNVVPVLLLAALTAAAFGPGFLAQVVGDDWGFVAIGRHLVRPWDFYFFDHSSSYFYRPNGMVLWWATVQLFGVNASAHMVVNFVLHAANSLLLLALLRELSDRHRICYLLAALFAVHPIGIGTSLWLADRFDLLATFAVLWALLELERVLRTGKARSWLVVASLLAAGSKETAIVLPVVAFLRIAIAGDVPKAHRMSTFCLVTAPFAAMLIARVLLLQPVETTLVLRNMIGAAVGGITAWFALSPYAVAGGNVDDYAGVLVVLSFLLVLMSLILGPARDRWRNSKEALVVGCSLAMLPAMIQWPVTQGVLTSPAVLDNSANLRFFYLASSGAAIALLPLISVPIGEPVRRFVLAELAACVFALTVVSHDRASRWAAATSEERVLFDAAAMAVAAAPTSPRCRIHLLGAPKQTIGTFQGFVDVGVKAQLPKGSPALACVVFTEKQPWFTMTAKAGCSDADWLPLRPRTSPGGSLGARRVGNLCYHYFDTAAPEWPGERNHDLWYKFEGNRFVRQTAAKGAGAPVPGRSSGQTPRAR